jgi:hypothetical protein
MQMGDLASWFEAAGGLGAAVAGVAAWRTARELARIERGRDHIDLTPTFETACSLSDDQRRAKLSLTMAGPAGLESLDSITVIVRDDRIRKPSNLAAGPTAEQVAGQIWGPLQFRRGVDSNSQDGRSSGPYDLPLGESLVLALDATQPPSWASTMTDTDWLDQFEGQPLRVTLRCERAGQRPWIVPCEVSIDKPQAFLGRWT